MGDKGKVIRLALTPGDPAGIGPEITARLLEAGRPEGVELVIVGSGPALRRVIGDHTGETLPVISAGEMDRLEELPGYPVVIDTSGGEDVPPGRPSPQGGRVSGRSVEVAASLARRGKVHGIVTGPLSKEALNLGGYKYSGHTEMLADIFESPDCQMMMVNGEMRVVILSRDIPLRKAPDSVTPSRLRRGIEVTCQALQKFWNIGSPYMAVAALNPHGGDGGVTGREEIDVISPVLNKMREEGYNLDGPVPADTLFCHREAKEYHAFIALYHDQGMIPFKMSGFERGVNMTIGLPVIRTSVCHGTAFDIAGRGEGSEKSLEAAVCLARDCAAAAGGGGTAEGKVTGVEGEQTV